MSLTFAPILQTDRLILRGPARQDSDPIVAFLMDETRSKGFGHIPIRGEAWRWFALLVGHWHIRGYGYFVIEQKGTGVQIGICGIWNPEDWPEPEIGWAVFDGFEGQGYAYEAATRVRRYAYTDLGLTTLTSNIVPGNTRSQALARRLGAQFERTYDNTNMGLEELWRHPGPDEVLA
jgi:RimJ/RimL family protein N-acetyltransferase